MPNRCKQDIAQIGPAHGRALSEQHTKVNADGTVVNFVAHVGWLIWGGREVVVEESNFSGGSDFDQSKSCSVDSKSGSWTLSLGGIEISEKHQSSPTLTLPPISGQGFFSCAFSALS